jgi:hypothetical protein
MKSSMTSTRKGNNKTQSLKEFLQFFTPRAQARGKAGVKEKRPRSRTLSCIVFFENGSLFGVGEVNLQTSLFASDREFKCSIGNRLR